MFFLKNISEQFCQLMVDKKSLAQLAKTSKVFHLVNQKLRMYD